MTSFTFYFCILTTWALQVQFLLQIIINRCAILLTNQKSPYRLKIGVAILITLVNISVYNIWIPARLQISERYVSINEWWDRVEKGIYLIVDASLNFYFIRIVQQSLVGNGLTKYRSLVKFNMFLVAFSLSMDVLIISMMSLDNTFVYMQFHPLAYIVKLNIEMSMADLIGKVARQRRCGIISNQSFCDFDVAEDEGMDRHIYTSNNRARISIDGKERKYRPGNVPYAVELQRQPAAKFVDYNPGEVKRRAVLLSEPCSPSISQWRTLPREGGDQDDATLSSRCTSTCSVATGSFEQSRYWWSEDDRATRTMI
ncbi:hypothetical protein GQ53DRAFT_717789 [Thozetella sp. PMI_491]|nr:hypothetical protein GQ53DRAFT_717789 [Thozetella sp. PMI_491]